MTDVGLAKRRPLDAARSLSRLPASEFTTRLLIASLTLAFGAAGLFMIPADQFTEFESILIGISSLSTVPVAALWLVLPWPSARVANTFVVYSDVGILLVLGSFASPFNAMPGCAMFSIVALFTVVATSELVLTLHLALSVACLGTLATLAVLDGVNAWEVASRTTTLATLFTTPLILQAYIRFLRGRALTALRDPLTGLWNRRGLFDAVDAVNAVNASAGTAAVAVTVVDIDNFKDINDRYGHPSGDAVLVEVAARLDSALSAHRAVVSRLGGDEFVCVHVGTHEQVTASENAIRSTLEEWSDGPMYTTSIGTAHGTVIRGDSIHAQVRRLMALADIEMYRNKIRPTADSERAVAIRERVTALVAAGGPDIVAQPICDVHTREVRGYEFLSRFPYGHGNPLTWFRDATEAGVGPVLELAAMDRALDRVHLLEPGAFVSLNASAETVRSHDLLTRLRPHLATRRICIEITEHESVDDYRAVVEAVDHLRSAGVMIGVDDVGAGFAGLRQVVELEPDLLKLDYAIVHGIDADPVRRAAGTALVVFARAIGAQLVMEGIETESELEAVREIGTDLVQGYLTGRPVG